MNTQCVGTYVVTETPSLIWSGLLSPPDCCPCQKPLIESALSVVALERNKHAVIVQVNHGNLLITNKRFTECLAGPPKTPTWASPLIEGTY